jgi:hypothetical protein
MGATLDWHLRHRAEQASDVLQEMRDTLEALGCVDRAYGCCRIRLDRWSGSGAEKDRLRDWLDKFHPHDRAPLVLRLADLQEEMIKAAAETFH